MVLIDKQKSDSINDPILNGILERINAPHLSTLKFSTDQQFRRSVADRLLNRKIEDLNQVLDYSELPTEETTCHCCCTVKDRKNVEDTKVVWRRMECKTMASFEPIAVSSISNSVTCIRGLRKINQGLSYWEDPQPDWEGLSVIGGYMWLLTFSIQHLCDDSNPKGPMLPGVLGIQEKFQEIAQSGEIFSELMEHFHSHTQRIRTDAVSTVKNMVRKWKLESKSPFRSRPEISTTVIKSPKRRLGNKGLPDLRDELELCNENVFHMNWSPLTIKMRSTDIDWVPLYTLSPQERVYWIAEFSQKTLAILELAAEDLTFLTGEISSIDILGDGDEQKSHGRELSGALLGYSSSCRAPKQSSPEETEKLVRILSEYWYSADILHEEVSLLLRLVHETRDIIRGCYVYTGSFYKWELPTYDAFLTNVNTKRQVGSQTITTIKEAWDKFMSKDETNRKLSDVMAILVMMDFSTSAYQTILQTRSIECEGMFMKLEMDSLDKEDGYGLVSGVDKRRSRKSSLRNV